MLNHTFPYNRVLLSMCYYNDTLEISFRKAKGIQIRCYNGVSKEIAYKLFYLSTADSVLSFYSNQIKGKYSVNVK